MSDPAKLPPIVLQGLPHAALDLLREIPHAAALDDPAAGERLFPAPGTEESLCDDWKSLVEPDLQQAFLSARQIVAADLAAVEAGNKGVRLTIPRHHVDAWLSALNQVRLALAAAHNLGEKEINAHEFYEEGSPISDALLRIHFFGHLQETLLASLEQ
jgi:hypothetical protein